jgi:hypothetical protein
MCGGKTLCENDINVSLEIVINEIKKNLPKLDREVWTHISLT